MSNPTQKPDQILSDADAALEIARRTRRGFIVGAAAALAGLGGWRWLMTRKPEPQDAIPWPLRKMHQFNEMVSGRVFDPNRLLAERPESELTPGGPRANGRYGLKTPIDLDTWRLRVTGTDLALTLDDLRTLPQVTQITTLHCIEGWTTVARWGGVRFADFVDKFCPGNRSKPYVSMITPDDEYFVGLDMPSALHPQTLLCHSINGEPLAEKHGAPLRLLIPVKYGIKNLKRIGTIAFADTRPRDYWAEEGYDWFSAL